MKKIRFTFKKINIDWIAWLSYILLVVLSSTILVTIIIALPMTNRFTEILDFNLNLTQDYWTREYSLTFESDNQSDIEKTRSIILRRLNRYGVEEAAVFQNNDEEISVSVKSSLEQTFVEELIRNPYRFTIVTRKDGIDFDNEEDPLVPFLEENYEETNFDYSTFRNIYVTKLPDASGTRTYFGIGKVWPHKSNEFTNFLEENIDEFIGVSIDGFVTPMYISDSSVFAIPLGGDTENAKVIDILYNTGNIPISYSFTETTETEFVRTEIDYIEITIALLLVIIGFYAYLYLTKTFPTKSIILGSFSTIFSLSILVSFLKISFLPINPYILLINAILIIIFTKIIITKSEYRYWISGALIVLATLFSLLGIGYIRIFFNIFLYIPLLILLSVIFSEIYINKISEYFKK